MVWIQSKRALICLVVLLGVICSALPQKKNVDDDGYSDDNRPYKFGFNIEKYQHRLEEKDKKGIIKGEFGFVTGDGVYHETAYATDENGDFKILGMRSYFVGLPGLDLPDITKGATVKVTAPPTSNADKIKTHLKGLTGCSNCIIPTKPTPFIGNPFNSQNNRAETVSAPGPSSGFIGGQFGDTRTTVAQPGQQGVPPTLIGQNGQFGQNTGSANGLATNNEQGGGYTAEDMLKLLYRFNYTVGFHGHHEIGDSAGNKDGGYFFNGRDGYARIVKYTANEFGYQPNITLQELGPESKATPREETEKNPEFGLKGYEFVWFNRRR